MNNLIRIAILRVLILIPVPFIAFNASLALATNKAGIKNKTIISRTESGIRPTNCAVGAGNRVE